jgi:HSP20 family protein
MQITPWSPFRGLTKVENQFNKMLEGSFPGDFWGLDVGGVDMYEEKGQLIVEASLPDFDEKDIEITAEGGALVIKGEHTSESERKDRKYIVQERASGSYWRRVTLPEGAKAEDAKATFEDGVLKVTMPAASLPAPKKIAIAEHTKK